MVKNIYRVSVPPWFLSAAPRRSPQLVNYPEFRIIQHYLFFPIYFKQQCCDRVMITPFDLGYGAITEFLMFNFLPNLEIGSITWRGNQRKECAHCFAGYLGVWS